MESNVWIAFLIGIVSTSQIHLAKALERQGIEVFDQLRQKFRNTGDMVAGDIRKPLIYITGLILNNTIFIYPIIAQRYAPPAVYTSVFGVGLVVLMIYAVKVLHEKISGNQVLGSALIIVGTLGIGIENILREEYDRSGMALMPALAMVCAFLLFGTMSLILVGRTKKLETVAITFGLFCGGCGSLDPFLKGVAQNLGGRPEWLPGSWLGWVIFISSFILGFIAFAITQVGFSKKAPAGILVPAYNVSYVLLPIILQVVLLPAYKLYWSTCVGITLIILGMILMRNLKR